MKVAASNLDLDITQVGNTTAALGVEMFVQYMWAKLIITLASC